MTSSIDRLLDIMARLRDPDTGCPWDVEQDFASIAPYTIEEAYEVADAIDRDDVDALRDELGDLLLQVVFHAQMAREDGSFDFAAVVDGICEKMVRRHPHVFGSANVETAAEQTRAWEDHKAAERGEVRSRGALDGVPSAMPALLRAEKLGKRAARVGFDWPTPAAVHAKIDEEIEEIRDAERTSDTEARTTALEHEIGDFLFAGAQLARKLGVNPETALRTANRRFERRFGRVEALLRAQGKTVEEVDLDAMEAAWNAAKEEERQVSSEARGQQRKGGES